MKRKNRIARLAAALIASSVALLTVAQATTRQIVTRNASGPVIVWDATPQIEGFVAQNIPFDRGVEQLKVHALELFVTAAHGFARKERHLTVNVVYARSGAISTRYQTKSFQGIGDALTLEGSPRVRLDPKWHALAERGRYPSGITIRVTNPAE